jgi:hypothetical protein
MHNVIQLSFDAHQLIVFSNTVGAAGAPVLIWPVLRATARSAYGGVFVFTGAV